MTQQHSPPCGEARAASASLAERFRRHADALDRADRSPLCVAIVGRAAQDIEAHGRVADLFAGVPTPPGSVPALRLLAALHHLVLSGRAPALASFYPSVGGDRPPDSVWPTVEEMLDENAEWVRKRLRRTVQTNEPGRAAVLFPALLWLTRRHSPRVRLLEIGASAGLNLLADRFSYLVGDMELGAAGSPVRFVEPWRPPPRIDLDGAASGLRVVERAGCDPAPLDPRDPEDRLTSLSYIWPDEPERLSRTRAALDLAADDPPRVVALPAEKWLPRALAARTDGELTVVWQSVLRQYVAPAAWNAIEAALAGPLQDRQHPTVWLCMEQGDDPAGRFQVTMKTGPEGSDQLLACCGFHGPPVTWEASSG